MHLGDDLGNPMEMETLLTHFAEEEKIFGAVTPPLFQNSLFVFDHVDDLMKSMSPSHQGPPYFYSRIANPTIEVVERKLAAMEGTDRCKVTGGGLSAITVALQSVLESGSHVVIVESAYGPAISYLRYMERFGVTHTKVVGESVEEVADAIRPETSAIYLESPSSIVFRLQDVPAITKIARERKVATFLDNTYCTPLYMRPAEFGVDVVIHSGSKYLGGHSDINAGAICTDEKRMARIVEKELGLYAALLHPFSAWLMLRSMRTLVLRIKQHEACANEVAAWLERRPEVERVHHVALPSFPQKELYHKLMSGSTGLFSFQPKVQNRARIVEFVDKLRLFQRGISWGGFESLVVPVHAVEHVAGEDRWLIRLFCGLETPSDLRADLEQALPLIAP